MDRAGSRERTMLLSYVTENPSDGLNLSVLLMSFHLWVLGPCSYFSGAISLEPHELFFSTGAQHHIFIMFLGGKDFAIVFRGININNLYWKMKMLMHASHPAQDCQRQEWVLGAVCTECAIISYSHDLFPTLESYLRCLGSLREGFVSSWCICTQLSPDRSWSTRITTTPHPLSPHASLLFSVSLSPGPVLKRDLLGIIPHVWHWETFGDNVLLSWYQGLVWHPVFGRQSCSQYLLYISCFPLPKQVWGSEIHIYIKREVRDK